MFSYTHKKCWEEGENFKIEAKRQIITNLFYLVILRYKIKFKIKKFQLNIKFSIIKRVNFID
jgi:hypothetical protein